MEHIKVMLEHLNHIRHIELEAAGLLGFYGVFCYIFIPNKELCGLAFWISLAFLSIIIKLDRELEHHWREFRRLTNEIVDDNIKRKFKGLLPLKGFHNRLISVHRIITTIILGLTMHFLTCIISTWIYDYWREILALTIAIAYLILDAARDWITTRRDSDC